MIVFLLGIYFYCVIIVVYAVLKQVMLDLMYVFKVTCAV